MIRIALLLLMMALNYEKPEYDYCPSVEEYVSPHEYEPVKMRVTCYLPTGNKTASGCYPYEGMCAGRREDIGKTAIIYDINKNYIGCFEIRDCGGATSLRKGYSLDIYRKDIKSAREWVKKYGDFCYVQIVNSEG